MTHDWMPHGGCVLWDPGVLTVQIISNLAIGICYLMIPIAILSSIRPIRDKWSRLFAAFITLCGVTHFMQVLVVWRAWYWLEAGILASTAIVSAMTVVNLYLQRVSISLHTRDDKGPENGRAGG